MIISRQILANYRLSCFFPWTCHRSIESQSQSQRLLRSSLPAADLTAEMETMAQSRGSMDYSFHLPIFPDMAWLAPSALPVPSLRARASAHQKIDCWPYSGLGEGIALLAAFAKFPENRKKIAARDFWMFLNFYSGTLKTILTPDDRGTFWTKLPDLHISMRNYRNW